jgi:F-type H+-transporting ATPase subunit delta
VAKRYALALFQQAQAWHCVDETKADMVALLETLSQTQPEALTVLAAELRQHPEPARQWLHGTLLASAHELTHRLVSLLIAAYRLPLLTEVAQAYLAQWDAEHRVATVAVTTAVEVDDAWLQGLKQQLCQRYQWSNVHMATHLNPALLAGFQLQLGDVRFDASLAGRLAALRQQLSFA